MELLASFHHSAKGNILLLYFNNRQKCMNINMMVGTLANNPITCIVTNVRMYENLNCTCTYRFGLVAIGDECHGHISQQAPNLLPNDIIGAKS